MLIRADGAVSAKVTAVTDILPDAFLVARVRWFGPIATRLYERHHKT